MLELQIAVVSQGTATLAAAFVAALAAVASLAATAISAYRREGREAQREAIRPYLGPLAEAIHQTVAMSSNQQKALASGAAKSASNWRDRSQAAVKELEKVRREVRYPLSGLDDGLRNLTRVPGWIAHRRGGEDGQLLLERADALAQELHRAVEVSWRRGQPPTWIRRRKIDARVKALRAVAPIGGAPRPEEGDGAQTEAPGLGAV